VPDDRWYPAIIVAALLVAMFYALHADLSRPLPPRSPRAPTQEQQPPTEKQQRAGGGIALPVEIITSPEHAAEAAEQKRQADENAATEKDLADATWKLAYFTLALAAFAGGQVVLFVWQLRLIRDSLNDTKIAAEAARDGAAAARDQASLTEQTAKRQLRAYISVEPGGIVEWIPGGQPSGKITARNVGATPAYKVEVAVKIHIISVTPETDITNSAPIVMSGDMVIVPSGHRNAQVVPTDIFGLPEWDDVFNRERWVIMFGYVKYLDVFGEKQKSRFCHLYQGENLGADFVRYHDWGNGAT
jgi:hypothetical protein